MIAEQPVWGPSAEMVATAAMTRFRKHVGARDYDELWRWSVDDIDRFWSAVWKWFDVQADGDPSPALGSREMPGAQWFPNVSLSFPEHVFAGRKPEDIAVAYASESGPVREWTWAELGRQTSAIRAGLVRLGVKRGDTVAAYLTNRPEAIAAFLAVSSLGATWSCCSPDFGVRTIVDRFSQIEPTVLLAVDSYDYGGTRFDRSDELARLQAALPSVQHTVVLSEEGPSQWDTAFPATSEPLAFERVPFDHPLWVVYSSGTTGRAKAIVHGHGGPLLENLRTWNFHYDIREGDRVFWFTTTGWVMWNLLVGALLSPGSIFVYDGSPTHPDANRLWDLVEEADITMFGSGAAYLHACMKRGLRPRDGWKNSRLRAVGSTGSPLDPAAYGWVRDAIGEDVWLTSSSGGTDIAGAFIGGTPLSPVYAGELQARLLGVAAEAWDDSGRSVIDEVGELVIREPMPSMPVRLWGDDDFERYRESYFSMFPGVWRQGDWVRFNDRGAAVILGRSDATINRAGIRMGSSEIYSAILDLRAVADALVVDVPDQSGGEGRMLLFVRTGDGGHLTEEDRAEIRARIRADCSPRHIPNDIIEAPDLPRTLSGKLMEVPVKRLLMGRGGHEDRGSIANPEAYDWFVSYASEIADGTTVDRPRTS